MYLYGILIVLTKRKLIFLCSNILHTVIELNYRIYMESNREMDKCGYETADEPTLRHALLDYLIVH